MKYVIDFDERTMRGTLTIGDGKPLEIKLLQVNMTRESIEQAATKEGFRQFSPGAGNFELKAWLDVPRRRYSKVR